MKKITEEFCKENGFKKEWFDESNKGEGHYWDMELYNNTTEGVMAITNDVDSDICYLYPYDGIRFTTQEQVLAFIKAFPCQHKDISRDGEECLDCFETVK